MEAPIPVAELTIVPANKASWDDLVRRRFHQRSGGLPRPVPVGWVAVEPRTAYLTWGEMHSGARQVFEDAGFAEVSRPTVRRVVMRIDFEETR